jgi:hypothetical protein
MAPSPTPLERLRSICMALPGATERLSHAEPSWFAGEKRLFVTFGGHHEAGPAFWCAAPPGAQQVLVEANPSRFFVPRYVGTRGWLGVRLGGDVDWDEVAFLVAQAFRTVAPAGLLQLMEPLGQPAPAALDSAPD